MKQLTAACLSALFAIYPTLEATAQTDKMDTETSRVSLFEYATKIPKKNKALELNLELHSGFNALFNDSKFEEAAFQFKDIKVHLSGEINERLFYSYRQKLNADYENFSFENLPDAIEYAYIGYQFSDHFAITVGKQDVAYGGLEYDPNPLDIYEYSDMNEYSLCFLTGVKFTFTPNPSQELQLQITNSRMGTMEEEYGRLPDHIQKGKAPFAYTLNWNSSYLDEMFHLRYSFSAFEQAKGKYMLNLFTGQSIDLSPVFAYFDVMYSRGALDPLGLITELTPTTEEDESEEIPVRVQNCDYLSLVAEIRYQFHPKWQVFAKGMYETASVYKTTEGWEKGKYRTAWGYQGGVEFYPFADDNLHLFLMGMGRSYRLEERAKALGGSLGNSAKLAVGFIYKLPLY